MEKKCTESLLEYAQQWCEQAVQVEPPITDLELATTFIDTLESPYYEFFIGNSVNNFIDLITTRE